jgi:DNA-binding MarR family transcriptional regulator/GNAT superfamily N-acetyltransferase
VADTQISGVRGFNRAVTRRIGALQDEYLSRSRSLGASRLLWEIDEAGSDVRTLRARLGLDSGYLSRLLRTLESERLIVVDADPADRRVRIARLTEAGREERRELDRRSDDLARSLLQPLTDRQRTRLVEAMATVRRLLAAGAVAIAIEPPTGEAAQYCLAAYFAELDARFDTGFDPAASTAPDAGEFIEPTGLLLIARLDGQPVGCGALRLRGEGPAEIKRMWVSSSVRGLGLARRLLSALEGEAGRRGASAVRLDTNRNLAEAINLYRSSDYVEIPAFNDERYAHHWFEKPLAEGSLRR